MNMHIHGIVTYSKVHCFAFFPYYTMYMYSLYRHKFKSNLVYGNIIGCKSIQSDLIYLPIFILDETG